MLANPLKRVTSNEMVLSNRVLSIADSSTATEWARGHSTSPSSARGSRRTDLSKWQSRASQRARA
jgi:hypothetical protein